jgi:hypothetical protein
MTLTDEILSLASLTSLIDGDLSRQRASADLALFAAAADRGADSLVARAVRELRPAHDAAATALTAWTAWETAAAAMAGLAADPAGLRRTDDTDDLVVPMTVCAAATAATAATGATVIDDDLVAAVAAGGRAAGLVASRLAGITGWSVPAIAAVIGATVAAGVLLCLPEDQLRHALGIAATQAAGLRAADATDAGPLQAGKAAFNAVEAAFLAQAGFTSSRDPLAGRRGLLALLAGQRTVFGSQRTAPTA